MEIGPFLASGFTLIELMVTLGVLSIALAIGVPSLRQFVIDNRVTAQANLLVSSLNVARSEAIKRSDNIVVTANSGTNWHLGWTVATSGGTTLRTQEAFEGDATLVGTANSITFAGTGFPSAATSYELCNPKANSERAISVVSGGRVNLDRSYACP